VSKIIHSRERSRRSYLQPLFTTDRHSPYPAPATNQATEFFDNALGRRAIKPRDGCRRLARPSRTSYSHAGTHCCGRRQRSKSTINVQKKYLTSWQVSGDPRPTTVSHGRWVVVWPSSVPDGMSTRLPTDFIRPPLPPHSRWVRSAFVRRSANHPSQADSLSA